MNGLAFALQQARHKFVDLPAPGKLEVIIKPSVDPQAIENRMDALIEACRNSILEDLDEPDLLKR